MAIFDWLESHIDDNIKLTGSGSDVHFNCVICGETRHRMYVNLHTGAVYCHNCGYKSSSILGLIQYLEGASFTRAQNIFNEIKGNLVVPESISKDTINGILIGDLRKSLNKRAIPLPEEYEVLDPKHTNILTKRAVKYLHKRKISDQQIIDHHMGFCASGEYKNRVIIPITENGILRFWVARAISSDEKLKEKSPSDADYQISKSEVIFNLDRATQKYHAAVISEGIFDALSYGDIGVSLLGKSLYQEQLNLLLDYRTQLSNGVFISLDWDARDKATELAERLSEYFSVYIINIPKELDDPNNCLQIKGHDYMLSLIESAECYEEMSAVRRLLS